jgi:hypothetical protein
MDQLVELLSHKQPVEVSDRPEATLERFQERLAINYVLVKFPATGTELGVKLDPKATSTTAADFAHASGTVQLKGSLNLNYTHVAFEADIDLATLRGTGCLQPVA